MSNNRKTNPFPKDTKEACDWLWAELALRKQEYNGITIGTKNGGEEMTDKEQYDALVDQVFMWFGNGYSDDQVLVELMDTGMCKAHAEKTLAECRKSAKEYEAAQCPCCRMEKGELEKKERRAGLNLNPLNAYRKQAGCKVEEPEKPFYCEAQNTRVCMVKPDIHCDYKTKGYSPLQERHYS